MQTDTLVLIKTKSEAVPSILTAVAALVPAAQITMFKESVLPPPADKALKDFEDLAKRIAKKIRSKPNQKMRREVNEFVLKGKDTFKDSVLDIWVSGDASLRNGLGALSKALKRFFPWEASPIDRLARREKIFDKSGQYLGTRYYPTKLGNRVRELLEAEGGF